MSTETTAPILSRQLESECDLYTLHGLPGSYKDGPRAWRIVESKIHGGERSEMDKDFYRAAGQDGRGSR